MELTKAQIELLEKIEKDVWVSTLDLNNIHMNTVYALVEKGLMQIKWEGDIFTGKRLIRKI